jgi:hypothetical protein
LDFEGCFMDSLAVSATSAAIAFAIIAWGFAQVYG